MKKIMYKEKVRNSKIYKYLGPIWHFLVDIKQFVYWQIYRSLVFHIKGILKLLRIGKTYEKYKTIEAYKNIYSSEDSRCFVVATGPSLKVEDLEKLEGEICIAVNGIFKIYSQTEWRPDYYALIDEVIYENYISKDPELKFSSLAKQQSFICDLVEKKQKKRNDNENITYVSVNVLDHRAVHEPKILKYCGNLLYGHYDALTVTNFAINLAQYMGFKKIFLLGVDCNYGGKYKYFMENDSSYYHTTKADAEISYKRMVKGYNYINNELKKYDCRVFNATRGGKLEVFPRVNFDDLIKEK